MMSGLGVQLLVARLAGVDGFGVWSLFMNLFLVFSTLSDWGTSLNGPRVMQMAGGVEWAAGAMYWRKKLSVIASLFMFFVVLVFYSREAGSLLLGLPMVLFYGMLSDWYDRGRQMPHRVAVRQIVQSMGQLLSVGTVVYFGGSLAVAIGAYAAVAASTYLIWHPRKKLGLHQAPPDKSWLFLQLPVLLGWVAYFLNYNLPVLLLGYFGGPTETGFYASHYFLYTSLATLTVITMEIFMAKPSSKEYGKWLVFFTVVAMLGIALSKFYYPYLFTQKGFGWNPSLTLMMVLLCAIHSWRLYSNNFLLSKPVNWPFAQWNLLPVLVQVLIVCIGAISGGQYTPENAALYLLMSEGVVLLFFQLVKARLHV